MTRCLRYLLAAHYSDSPAHRNSRGRERLCPNDRAPFVVETLKTTFVKEEYVHKYHTEARSTVMLASSGYPDHAGSKQACALHRAAVLGNAADRNGRADTFVIRSAARRT